VTRGVNFIRRRREDGRRGGQGADKCWHRWWSAVQYEASSALSFASRREGRGEWERCEWE
jgi:hypothetical protein